MKNYEVRGSPFRRAGKRFVNDAGNHLERLGPCDLRPHYLVTALKRKAIRNHNYWYQHRGHTQQGRL